MGTIMAFENKFRQFHQPETSVFDGKERKALFPLNWSRKEEFNSSDVEKQEEKQEEKAIRIEWWLKLTMMDSGIGFSIGASARRFQNFFKSKIQ